MPCRTSLAALHHLLEAVELRFQLTQMYHGAVQIPGLGSFFQYRGSLVQPCQR